MGSFSAARATAGDVSILNLSGNIILGDGSEALRKEIRCLLAEGKKKILLNLENVHFLDSSGIGELISAYTTVRREGGELKLLNLTRRIEHLMTITKLLTVFDVYEDESEALGSFK